MTPEWTSFFTVLTPVTGAILALLFVALQVNEIHWDLVPLRHAGAVRSLIEIGTPLVVGLFALYPGGRWWLGALTAGFVGLASIAWYWWRYLRLNSENPQQITGFDRRQAVGSIVPTCFYGLMVTGGLLNNDLWLHIVGWLCIWLTTAGVIQSWSLLVAKAPPGGSPEDAR